MRQVSVVRGAMLELPTQTRGNYAAPQNDNGVRTRTCCYLKFRARNPKGRPREGCCHPESVEGDARSLVVGLVQVNRWDHILTAYCEHMGKSYRKGDSIGGSSTRPTRSLPPNRSPYKYSVCSVGEISRRTDEICCAAAEVFWWTLVEFRCTRTVRRCTLEECCPRQCVVSSGRLLAAGCCLVCSCREDCTETADPPRLQSCGLYHTYMRGRCGRCRAAL